MDNKVDSLKRIRVVEESAAVSMAGWTLEKFDMIHERDDLGTTGEHLNSDLKGLCKQDSDHASVQCL